MGLPYLGPYNVNSILNPILVHCLGLATCSTCTGTSRSCARAAPSSCSTRCPGSSTSPPPQLHRLLRGGPGRDHRPEDDRVEVRGEVRDATRGTSHLYRTSHAYHGVHPFYMWYWGAHGRDHAGDVIFVGGEPKSVARLGLPARRLAARRAGDGEGHRRLESLDHVLPRAARHDRGRALTLGMRHARAEGDGERLPLGPAAAGAALGRAHTEPRRSARSPRRGRARARPSPRGRRS